MEFINLLKMTGQEAPKQYSKGNQKVERDDGDFKSFLEQRSENRSEDDISDKSTDKTEDNSMTQAFYSMNPLFLQTSPLFHEAVPTDVSEEGLLSLTAAEGELLPEDTLVSALEWQMQQGDAAAFEEAIPANQPEGENLTDIIGETKGMFEDAPPKEEQNRLPEDGQTASKGIASASEKPKLQQETTAGAVGSTAEKGVGNSKQTLLEEDDTKENFSEMALSGAGYRSGENVRFEESEESITTLPVNRPEELPEKLTEQLSMKLSRGIHEFEIRITPENLGEIAVKVAYDHGRTMISIQCSEKTTWAMIAQNAREIGAVMEQNLGSPTTIVVDKPETDYLEQNGGGNDQTGREAEQERQKEENQNHRQEAGHTDQFLQKLRLGLSD